MSYYPVDRVWTSTYTMLTDSFLAYLKTNNIELVYAVPGRWMQYGLMNVDITPSITPGGFPCSFSPTGWFNLTRDIIQRCATQGIALWLDIDMDMNNRAPSGTEGWNVSTPYATYQSTLGAPMAALTSQGAFLKGFMTELTGDNGIQWLSDQAHGVGKKAIQNWGFALGTTYKPLNANYADSSKGMDWRISLVDEVCFYDYYRVMHESTPAKISWIRGYAPSYPIGITFVLGETPGGAGYNYFSESGNEALGGSAYYVPYATQLVIAQQWLPVDAYAAGGFEVVIHQPGNDVINPVVVTPPQQVIAAGQALNLHTTPSPAPSSNFPVETNCIIRHSQWPSSGTTVINEMNIPGHNAVAGTNEFYTLTPTLATSFKTVSPGCYVYTSKGGVFDNVLAHTAEVILYYRANTVLNSILYTKAMKYFLQLMPSGAVLLKRYGSDGTSFMQWATAGGVVTPGVFYHIQVSWDATLTAPNTCATPLIKVNNVAKTVSASHSGTVSAWADDSAASWYWCNSSINGTLWTDSALLLARLHLAALSTGDLSTNVAAEAWRYTGVVATEWLSPIEAAEITNLDGTYGATATLLAGVRTTEPTTLNGGKSGTTVLAEVLPSAATVERGK